MLQDQEITDRLKTSLREAGQACVDLTSLTRRRGSGYHRLREHLDLAEGCCRQLSAFREDWRWTELGMQLSKSKEMARKWLDGYNYFNVATGETEKRTYTPKRKAELFGRLASNLAFFLVGVEEMMHRKTGVIGKPILPEVPYERRIGSPVQGFALPGEYRTKSGIILPRGSA